MSVCVTRTCQRPGDGTDDSVDAHEAGEASCVSTCGESRTTSILHSQVQSSLVLHVMATRVWTYPSRKLPHVRHHPALKSSAIKSVCLVSMSSSFMSTTMRPDGWRGEMAITERRRSEGNIRYGRGVQADHSPGRLRSGRHTTLHRLSSAAGRLPSTAEAASTPRLPSASPKRTVSTGVVPVTSGTDSSPHRSVRRTVSDSAVRVSSSVREAVERRAATPKYSNPAPPAPQTAKPRHLPPLSMKDREQLGRSASCPATLSARPMESEFAGNLSQRPSTPMAPRPPRQEKPTRAQSRATTIRRGPVKPAPKRRAKFIIPSIVVTPAPEDYQAANSVQGAFSVT